MRRFEKNVPKWEPTVNDYMLAFREVDGYWREISGNVPQYANMIFAEYLDEMDIALPDDCVFCRIKRNDDKGVMKWEFKQYSGILYVYYKYTRI